VSKLGLFDQFRPPVGSVDLTSLKTNTSQTFVCKLLKPGTLLWNNLRGIYFVILSRRVVRGVVRFNVYDLTNQSLIKGYTLTTFLTTGGTYYLVSEIE
jgi:hypothetical protein